LTCVLTDAALVAVTVAPKPPVLFFILGAVGSLALGHVIVHLHRKDTDPVMKSIYSIASSNGDLGEEHYNLNPKL
jgi:hypothetical protein